MSELRLGKLTFTTNKPRSSGNAQVPNPYGVSFGTENMFASQFDPMAFRKRLAAAETRVPKASASAGPGIASLAAAVSKKGGRKNRKQTMRKSSKNRKTRRSVKK